MQNKTHLKKRHQVSIRSFGFILVTNLYYCNPVSAEISTVFHPYVGYAITYDNNLLDLPNKDYAQTHIGTDQLSDLSHTMQAGVNLEKQVSRQVFTANLGVNKTNFDHFKQLDYTGKNLLANWNWHLGNHFEGNLSTSYVYSLAPFTDFHELAKNTSTEKVDRFNAAWLLHPSWRLHGEVARFELQYNLPSEQHANRIEHQAEAGIDYLTRKGSSVGVLTRHLQGTFPNVASTSLAFVPGNYNQNEVKANINWIFSGKTQLQFLGGHVTRTHEDFPRINYSGFNARLAATWQATGKMTLSSQLWREASIYDNLATPFSINRGISLNPKWRATDKITAEGTLQYVKRDFSQSQAFLGQSEFSQDTLRTVAVTLTYMPWHPLTVQAIIFHNSKISDTPFDYFNKNGLTISTLYQF